MPKLTVEGVGEFDVATGKRLVLALTEAGIDQLHACGGNAPLHHLSRRIRRRRASQDDASRKGMPDGAGLERRSIELPDPLRTGHACPRD